MEAPPELVKVRIMSPTKREGNTLKFTPPAHPSDDQCSVPVNSVDTIKHIIKHIMKNKGKDEEPSEEEINQAMREFQGLNKVPQRRH